MTERVIVRRGAYYDSVTLMLISRDAGRLDGVDDAAAVSGTPLNLGLLERQGYALDGAADAGPNDLIIVIRAQDDASADSALAEIDARLANTGAPSDGASAEQAPRSLTSAARRRPDLNLAFLSVPGRHVAYEAALALRAGMHVFCFSDGLSVEEEVKLKRRALDQGLLFMGADCGTAILDGVALGFANAVEPGPVGIVGASGTGIQQLTCLLDAAGVGISQAIGVGGRDLSATVGGLMTERGLELLDADPATETVIVVSKPPDPEVAARIAARAGRMSKPVVLAFLGADSPVEAAANVTVVDTLEGAAGAAAAIAGATPYADDAALPLAVSQGYVRGLFSGGTLCDEAMAIAAASLGPIASNIPLRPEWRMADIAASEGHTFIDFGDDEFTEGRAHPMIDPSLRNERFASEAADPEVGVILMDVVLGHGAHPDPAASLAAAIAEARDKRQDPLSVVVSLCGTQNDPQGLARQRAQLQEAGAMVARSNAHAARLALAVVGATSAAVSS
jgi:FdrA protein